MLKFKRPMFISITFLLSFLSFFIHAEDLSFCDVEFRLDQLSDEKDEEKRLQNLFALYWDWQMLNNPEEATFYGYSGQLGQWVDLSPEAIELHHYLSKKLLKLLNSISITKLEEENHISYSILKRILEEEKENSQFFDHYLLVNQLFGIHLHIPSVIEIMPSKTMNDYENILSRLRGIPKLLEQATSLLQEGVKAGITPPQIAIVGVPEQIRNLILKNPHESSLLKAFQNFPSSFNQKTQSRLSNEAIQIYQNVVCPSLEKFFTFISEKYLPNCRQTIAFCDLPNGQTWYSHKICHSTTVKMTPEEIHTLGLKEVERIQQEMVEVINLLNFKGNFQEFLYFLQTDPQFFHTNREELLKSYQTLTLSIEERLPLLFSHLPKQPFEVVPIPSYSEESQIGAYYCPGSMNDGRPGYFFINTSYPEKRAKWEMESLALHEAVPGHHLQISLAQELENLPEFRKNVHFTAYIEGWGLYAEGLGVELGVYQDPYSFFGRLSNEMLRAIRLVVDTGMHLKGWSREQAIQFFKQYVPMSEHEIEREVDRYLVFPGQALAYKIGELKILNLRRLAKETLGDQFDLRAFHHAFLKHGALPLDIAEKEIVKWIEQLHSDFATQR